MHVSVQGATPDFFLWLVVNPWNSRANMHMIAKSGPVGKLPLDVSDLIGGAFVRQVYYGYHGC